MESITHPIREGMLQLRRAGSRDFQSLHSLDDICLQMLNDIESFESQIQESSERGTKMPSSMEDFDLAASEVQLLKGSVGTAEAHLASMGEKYNHLQTHISEIRDQISKLRRKIMYNNTQNIGYQKAMQPVDFSVLQRCTLSPDVPYTSFEELSPEEMEDLLSEIGIVDGNTQLSPRNQIEHLKTKLAAILYEKRRLQSRVSRLELRNEKIALISPELMEGTEPFPYQGSQQEVDCSSFKRGFLQKMRGGTLSKWQKRYFSIEHNNESGFYVLVYRMKEKGPIIGQIALPSCQVTESNLREFGFCVNPRFVDKKQRLFVLAASSSEEMKEWMDTITKASKKQSTPEQLATQGYRLQLGESSTKISMNSSG